MKRIPRPQGLTLISQQLTNKPNEEVVEKLFQYLLGNRLEYKGQVLSLSTIGQMVNMSEIAVYKRFMAYQNKLSKAFLGKGQDTTGALGFFSLKAALEGYLASSAQLAVLTRSQGGQYKPYISSSVNEALGQNTAAIRTLLDYYKVLKPTGPTNALQINNYGASEGNNPTALKTISINEAMKLLDDKGINKIGYDENLYPEVKTTHLSESVPEVRATHQDMSRSDAMPLILPGTKAKAEGTTMPTKAGHITRRIKEEGIDEENDI